MRVEGGEQRCGRQSVGRLNQISDQRLVLGQTTDLHDCETEKVAVFIDTFHDGVVRGFAHVACPFGEQDFQEVGFGVVPDFYVLGPRTTPFFGLSVK